jgi:hypothetical protein
MPSGEAPVQRTRDGTLNASGLFVLKATVIVNNEPQAQQWIALLVLPAAMLFWGIGLGLRTVLLRVAAGRRRSRRGLINDTPTAAPADFTASSGTSTEPTGGGTLTFRLFSIADPSTDVRRLHSLDALRGLALCTMIFCNGDTGYPVFQPSRPWWVGLPTVADIVPAGFTWCLGFSLALVAGMSYSRQATKAALFSKVALRAACLLAIALGLERTGHSNGGITYLTPLSRLSAVYFVVGATMVVTP